MRRDEQTQVRADVAQATHALVADVIKVEEALNGCDMLLSSAKYEYASQEVEKQNFLWNSFSFRNSDSSELDLWSDPRVKAEQSARAHSRSTPRMPPLTTANSKSRRSMRTRMRRGRSARALPRRRCVMGSENADDVADDVSAASPQSAHVSINVITLLDTRHLPCCVIRLLPPASRTARS